VHQCSSDLCRVAAQRLLDDLDIDKELIDALIFVSQTPDYRLPATACVLQDILGLKKSCLAFDVNMGCSGYVYGLSTVYAYANIPGVNRVLLLVGDTPSKFSSLEDKTVALLFGDAGSASLIEKTNRDVHTWFSLHTDGSGVNALYIPNGGYRNMSTCDGLTKREIDGNIRHQEHLYMDGGEIFNFTIRKIPISVKHLEEYAGIFHEEINVFYFHQANKFMLDFLAKKMKIDLEQMPISLMTFGNTSAASIPLTIVNHPSQHQNVFLSGFGVGLSWANCITGLANTYITNLIEI
jgi:3-oxoacyl-[acyl-carrier-protein] synthase-3